MNAKRLVVLVLIVAPLFGQVQASPEAAFEVASIRPSAPQTVQTLGVGVHIDGAQVRLVALTLKDYLSMAYRVRLSQISGPDWVGSDRFDISATMPAGSSTAQFPGMLRALLAERFQVKLHHETKDFPVYALEVDKGGIKMQEVAPEADTSPGEKPVNVTGGGSVRGVAVNLGDGSSYAFSNNRFEARKMTMANLARNLERFVDRPMLDMTGLKGRYDFALDVTEEDYRAMLVRSAVSAGVALPPQALRALEVGSPVSLFQSMQKLGLKVDARKAPLDLLVVDEASKTPTEN